jgi:hypothetical protein
VEVFAMRRVRAASVLGAVAMLAALGGPHPAAHGGTVLPAISIDGAAAPDIGSQIVGLEIEERRNGSYDLSLRVGNFGPRSDGTTGYLYFDDSRVAIGKTLEVALGGTPAVSYSGGIEALRAIHEEGSSPILELIARGAQPVNAGADPLPLTPIGFTGERRGAGGRATEIATAEIAGTPGLRPGVPVAFEGQGDWFTGTFQVRSARHTFDLTRGFRSTIAVVRKAR